MADLFQPLRVLHKSKHGGLYLVALLACFLALGCSNYPGDTINRNTLPRPLEEKTADVVIAFSAQENVTHYSITDGNCSITWIARNTEPGVIKHHAACGKSLAFQVPLLIKICEAIFNNGNHAGVIRLLFWPSLESGTKQPHLEMSYRLALAAFKSPEWNKKMGKPKKEGLNKFVKDLANREMIYPELKEVFGYFNKSITLSTVEKVLVMEAEKLPFYDSLKEEGVKLSDKLPYDCMAWFSVSDAIRK
jgi:hypothetical protein